MKNDGKWDGELRHSSVFGSAMLFSCPELGRYFLKNFWSVDGWPLRARFFRSQILWRLYRGTLDETINWCFHDALRPRRRDGLLGTGQSGRGTREWRLDRGKRPKKTGETVDRRQNNGSVKAVSPRHCPATCALRNWCFNCCAGQSH